MKKKIFYIIISCMSVLWVSCKEEGRIDHFDDAAPAPVQIDKTTVTVRNTAGGAVVKYRVPADKNLLYVLAKYETQPGVVREAVASCFEDSLVMEGFGETRAYDVQLYSIGRNKKASEPITVQVNPATSPLHLIEFELKETYGGVSVKIKNPKKIDVVIELMGDTTNLGYQSILNTFYTSKENASFAVRGLDTVAGNFSVLLRDRWNNRTSSKIVRLKPMYEEFIPKDTWKRVMLPNDVGEAYPVSNPLERMWNGNITTESMYMSTLIGGMIPPVWCTWDLGVTVTMSRFIYWYSPAKEPYWDGMIRVFELWGTADTPPADGSWDGWTCLGRFETARPSGSDTNTAEDIAFARSGFEFELEPNEYASDPFVPVRYLRLKVFCNWLAPTSCYFYVQEISIYGMRN